MIASAIFPTTSAAVASAGWLVAATVECTINNNGRPKDCTVVAEDGNNFSAFVKELAGQYKAASKDVDGQSSAGRKIRLTYTMDAAALHP